VEEDSFRFFFFSLDFPVAFSVAFSSFFAALSTYPPSFCQQHPILQ
jgi:hypothetical protein